VLGDEGGGYGIAREALAAIWRSEDDRPGFQSGSALARSLFADLGGSDWDTTRRFLQQSTRGTFGELARAVARAADVDPMARDILARAGVELARLARLLVERYGLRPVVVAGRAASLHPLIEQALRQALPTGVCLDLRTVPTHRWAAIKAAQEWPLVRA
jgi:N-acetylglucosamine kinase-like BadF-type ATPase